MPDQSHNSKTESKIIYFGSSNFSVFVLDELKKLGVIPSLIITTPDKPQGRKLVLQPNVVKTWAIQNNISFFDQGKLDHDFIEKLNNESYKTTRGYLKKIGYKEAFIKAWDNWNEKERNEIKSIENFDAEIFYEITGIKI